MFRQCDGSSASCRRRIRQNAVPTITPCTKIRREGERLLAVIQRLDAECFAARKRIEREMEAIQIELEMRVKRRSRPLSSLEVPPKHPPPYAEGFHPSVARISGEKDAYYEGSVKSSSNSERRSEECAKNYVKSANVSWYLDRIMTWYETDRDVANGE